MIGGLSREVISAVEELRNLKTAHLHGLGNTIFYRYFFTLTGLAPQRVTKAKIICTMAGDALFPPYITLTWVGGSAVGWAGLIFNSATVDASAGTVTFNLGLIPDGTELELAITSSSRVAGIERVE